MGLFSVSFSAFARVLFSLPRGLVVTIASAVVILSLSGCAGPAGYSAGAEGAHMEACKASDNLLRDVAFTRQGEHARAWREAQHTGERSFSIEAVDGVLEIRRIATQPWLLFRQTIDDSRLSGATIRFSAELAGDLPAEPPLHGFDHVGGLYLQLERGKARLAEHQPNHGQWDWQEFSYEEKVPVGVTRLRVGFVHQSGGALWVKNPSLVTLDCQ